MVVCLPTGLTRLTGDFGDEELAEAVDIEDRNALVARSIQELARDRRTIAFCVTVNHARNGVGLHFERSPGQPSEVVVLARGRRWELAIDGRVTERFATLERAVEAVAADRVGARRRAVAHPARRRQRWHARGRVGPRLGCLEREREPDTLLRNREAERRIVRDDTAAHRQASDRRCNFARAGKRASSVRCSG